MTNWDWEPTLCPYTKSHSLIGVSGSSSIETSAEKEGPRERGRASQWQQVKTFLLPRQPQLIGYALHGLQDNGDMLAQIHA